MRQGGRVRGLDGYTLLRELGTGRTGVTYLAVDKADGVGHRQFALKTVERGPKVDQCIAREVRIHGVLLGPHPNLVRWEKLVLATSHLVMVMEPCKGGDLFEFIDSDNARALLDEKMAWRIFLGLLRAVQFLHSNGVFHRDIKPENILLTVRPTTPDSAARTQVRLCDLGYAIDEPSDPDGDDVGTTSFVAPEVLDEDYTHYLFGPADVWSCVVVLYAMLFRALPFQDPDEKNSIHSKTSKLSDWHRDVVTRILACCWNRPTTTSRKVSHQALDLFAKTFVRDPARRPTLDAVIELATACHQGPVASVPDLGDYAAPQSPAEVQRILEQAAVQDRSCVKDPRILRSGRPPAQSGSHPELLSSLMASMRSGVRSSHSSPQLTQLDPGQAGASSLEEPMGSSSMGSPLAPSPMHRVMTAGDSLEQAYMNAKRFERQNQNESAARALRSAAERGHGLAQLDLGACYQTGRGVPKDYDAAAVWYREAASRGVHEALGRLNQVQEQKQVRVLASASSSMATVKAVPR